MTDNGVSFTYKGILTEAEVAELISAATVIYAVKKSIPKLIDTPGGVYVAGGAMQEAIEELVVTLDRLPIEGSLSRGVELFQRELDKKKKFFDREDQEANG